jgi:hypothetical protein
VFTFSFNGCHSYNVSMKKGGTNLSFLTLAQIFPQNKTCTVDHLKPRVNFAKSDLQISIYKDLKDFSKPYFKLVEHIKYKFQIKPIYKIFGTIFLNPILHLYVCSATSKKFQSSFPTKTRERKYPKQNLIIKEKVIYL